MKLIHFYYVKMKKVRIQKITACVGYARVQLYMMDITDGSFSGNYDP